MTGTVASRVIVVVASASAVGPAFPAASEAPLAAKRGVMVPLLHELTVTVRVVDDVSVPGLNEQPVAVPALEKSVPATPVTASEKVTVYVNDATAEGVALADVKETTVGAVVSRVMEVDDTESAVGPVLLHASVAPFAANRGMMVPSLHPDTMTVLVVPEVSVPGLNVQLVAVPVLEKSLAEMPVTASEKVTVYEAEGFFVRPDVADVNEETDGGVTSSHTAYSVVFSVTVKVDPAACEVPEQADPSAGWVVHQPLKVYPERVMAPVLPSTVAVSP